jgi:Domain of unknown function (DUF3535)
MLQKVLAAIVIEEWAKHYDAEPSTSKRPSLIEVSSLAREMSNRTLAWLQGEPPAAYHEMAFTLARIHGECTNLLQSFAFDCKVPWTEIPTLSTEIDLTGSKQGGFSLASAEAAVEENYTKLKERLGKTKKRELAVIAEKRKTVISSIERYKEVKTQHDIRVCAAFAAAYVALKNTPDKVSPIVKGVMNGIKVRPMSQLDHNILESFPPSRMKRIWIFKHAPQLLYLPSLTSAHSIALHNLRIRLSRTSAHSYARTSSEHRPLPIKRSISLASCRSRTLRKQWKVVCRKTTKAKAETRLAYRGAGLDWPSLSYLPSLGRSS